MHGVRACRLVKDNQCPTIVRSSIFDPVLWITVDIFQIACRGALRFKPGSRTYTYAHKYADDRGVFSGIKPEEKRDRGVQSCMKAFY